MCPTSTQALGPATPETGDGPLGETLVTTLPTPLPKVESPDRAVDLSLVAEQAILANRDLATSLGVALACHGPALVVVTDGREVQRVLEDLLSTALRRHPAEGWVTVDIAATAKGARITVSDRGLTLGTRDLRAVMGPTQAAAQRVGGGLMTQDGSEDGNGISFTVFNRIKATAPVH
ncbi:MAG: hypothetical protein K9H25_12985 [Rhodospirillum sp.]|nr:hypothetical protein [Rhodospirillum sp.]MCF8489295.1 hypothetical protein [Rhodospirillum sp.]MCF8500277.1 hypothetical protein [Rhodospirillum sp.]